MCQADAMSYQTEEEIAKYFTVFNGSSPEDVSHAKQLWASLSLLPPLEARLVPADVRQRLPVARPHRDAATALRTLSPERPRPPSPRQRREEIERYSAVAGRRKEILALLGKQREQRIQKELVSRSYKPQSKAKDDTTKRQKPSQELQMDKDVVKQLQ